MLFEQYYQIAKVNVKHNLWKYLLMASFFLCISPTILSIQNLDKKMSAKVLELFVALIGIILFVPSFLPENDTDIADLTASKYRSVAGVSLTRILEAGLGLLLLAGAYIFAMKQSGCQFDTMPYLFGTISEGAFLGAIGLVVYTVTGTIAIGYMAPMLYYMIAISTGDKYLKKLYLFSMMKGSYIEKYYLGLISIGLFGLIILIKHCKRR